MGSHSTPTLFGRARPGARNLPLHGGSLLWAQAEFRDAPSPWIDLSTGINPRWYPAEDRPDWAHLPEPAALDALLSAARIYYDVPPQREIVAVAGVELAIRLLPLILSTQGRVCIAGPTYGSHADAWHGAELEILPAVTEQWDCRVAVVVSPNNPDGRTTRAETLDRLAKHVEWLIADRSFADVCAERSALNGPDNVIELRSFGKFFGLPGLRLGFVIAKPCLADRLRSVLGAWPLNAAALSIGEKALCDSDWQQNTRERLQHVAGSLDTVLRQHLQLLGGTDLFRLIRVADAAALFRHLGSQGILTRIFDYEPSWMRIGLPADTAAEIRLADALAYFSGHHP